MGIRLDNVMQVQKAASSQRKRTLVIVGVTMIAALVLLVFILAASGMLAGENGNWMFRFVGFCIFVLVCVFVRFHNNKQYFSDSVLNLSDVKKERLNVDCMSSPAAGNAIFCRDGLLVICEMAELIPYRDIIYVYEDKNVGIRTTIILFDRYRKTYEINLQSNPLMGTGNIRILGEGEFWEIFGKKAPWAIFSSERDNSGRFVGDFVALVSEVDLRRKTMEGKL